MRATIVAAWAVLTGVAVLAAACSGGGGSAPADATPRPTGVPGGAALVTRNQTFGSPDGTSGGELFFSTSCRDGVLALVTTRRVVYAELPCDRALPTSVSDRFLGKPMRVRLVVASPSKIYLDSSQAGSVEFTVGRIWLVDN